MLLGSLGVGYAVFKYAPGLIPQKLELQAMASPSGFRKFTAGETSAGSFNPFVGLEDEQDSDQLAEALAADARVNENVCRFLYAGLELAPNQIPMASFSDYYCPFCRVQTKKLAELAKSRVDEVAIAWHELPLLGENSDMAAKAALAAKRQGAYVAFHDRLMRTPCAAGPEYLSRLAGDLGINEELLLADMDSVEVATELQNSAALSRVFAFVGTPALVIGRTVVQGQVNDRMINEIIELEREEGWAQQCGYA